MTCPYCKAQITENDVFCPACDSQLYTPKDLLTTTSISPVDSILKWIEAYRSGHYSLGQFQVKVNWLVEAVKLQKEQIEAMRIPENASENAKESKESFIKILGLMLEALEKTDKHLREGNVELLKESLVTIHDVHNRLHDLKDRMVDSFSRDELKRE
ncbi:MAG: hypothetical protein RDV48_04295 [Candidatus Eremiobacteraeota bacterium]|nr:hypothetical protein [Candidatus Eremiobacteraeota bacterium]